MATDLLKHGLPINKTGPLLPDTRHGDSRRDALAPSDALRSVRGPLYPCCPCLSVIHTKD